MKKKTEKKIKAIGQVIPFRVEDEAVAQALNESGNESRFINEAIRQCGGPAMLSILERDAMTAKHKFDRAVSAHAKRRSV